MDRNRRSKILIACISTALVATIGVVAAFATENGSSASASRSTSASVTASASTSASGSADAAASSASDIPVYTEDGVLNDAYCLSCHGPAYSDVAALTADLGDWNPHDSVHGGYNGCGNCHSEDMSVTDNYCDDCHTYQPDAGSATSSSSASASASASTPASTSASTSASASASASASK